jgi:hypothetical protein
MRLHFWVREIAGWCLVVLGLVIFYLCYRMLLREDLFDAGPLTIIGIFVFRGGIHLLKIAVAAEVCLDADSRLPGQPPADRALADPRPSRPASAPWASKL